MRLSYGSSRKQLSSYIDSVIWSTSWNAFLKTPVQACTSLPRTTSDTVKSINRSRSKLEVSLLKALTFMEIQQVTLLRNLLIMTGAVEGKNFLLDVFQDYQGYSQFPFKSPAPATTLNQLHSDALLCSKFTLFAHLVLVKINCLMVIPAYQNPELTDRSPRNP